MKRAQGERSLGLLAAQLGHFGEAIARFREAATLSQRPDNELTEVRNRLFLAWAEREKGWTDSSRVELQRVYVLFHKAYIEPAFLMVFEKALARSGDLRLAAEVLDTLRARARPNKPSDRANLAVGAGELALAEGHADSAVRAFRAAMALDSSMVVTESLAHALAAAGSVAESAQRYETFAAASDAWFGWEPEQYGLTAPIQAGELYERMGDRTHAVAAYEREMSQWSFADSDLVSLKIAQDRLKSLRGLDVRQVARH